MNKKVTYKNQVLQVDFDRTQSVYQQVKKGRDVQCACNYCANFSANKENIFPDEFKELLKNLAIDYKKAVEVYHLGKLAKGKHFYGGWFHFKGKIVKKDIEMIAITDDFKFEFSQKSSLSFFSKKECSNLVQIDFYTYSDWVIDRELENG
jgi:hypothetical protein